MEKTWEVFLETGKVTDYLSYKNSLEVPKDEGKGRKTDVTGRGNDRHGFEGHAHRGL